MNIDTAKLISTVGAERNAAATSQAQPAIRTAPVFVARAPAPSADTVRAAAAQIDSYLKSIGRSLDIRVDGDTGRMVVTVRNAATGETIRQIPSEEALQLARSLSANVHGAPVIFDGVA